MNPFMKARVEVNKDPDNRKRVRVRVLGIHPFNAKEFSEYQTESDVPNDMLPWAEQCVPPNTGKVDGGYGTADVPDEGDWVWVFFEDEAFQRPWYFAIISAKNDVNDKFKQTENRFRLDRWNNTVEVDEDKIELTMFTDDDLTTEAVKITAKKDGSVSVLSKNNPGVVIDMGGDTAVDGRSSAVNFTNLNTWMKEVEIQLASLWNAMFEHTHDLLEILPLGLISSEKLLGGAVRYTENWKLKNEFLLNAFATLRAQAESAKMQIPSYADSAQVPPAIPDPINPKAGEMPPTGI